jgi:hypothetical protein
VTYEIELFHPSALPGAGAQTEVLGPCRILTKNVFVTVTEHNGTAHVVLLDEISVLDRTAPFYVTLTGKTFYPRRVDFPSRIYVETQSGHARALASDTIARMTIARRDSQNHGRVSW